MKIEEGIHPRNSFKGKEKNKKNTCKPRNRKRFERALIGVEKHLLEHPKDVMSQTRVGELKRIIAGLSATR
jgi:hypothetical protein